MSSPSSPKSPKPKRPGAKHHDSFIHKIRKRHDQRHHADEVGHSHDNTEQQPLLQEEHPDSASAVEAYSPEETQEAPPNRIRAAVANVGSSAKNTVSKTTHRVAEAAKKVPSALSKGFRSAGNALKSCTSWVGSMIKNNPKRVLGIICAILLLICIGEAIDISKHHRQPHNETNLCSTPACVHAASKILKDLHPAYPQLDPCEDFDQYVCGGFRLNHELYGDQSSVSTWMLTEDHVITALGHILNQDEKQIKKGDTSIFTKVKNAYIACKDEDKIKDYGAKPLKGIVDFIRGYFTPSQSTLRKSPTYQVVLDPASNRSMSLSAAVAYMTKLEIETFVSFRFQANYDVDHLGVAVQSPSSASLLTTKDYQDKELMEEYTKSVETALAYFYHLPANSSVAFGRYRMQATTSELARSIVQLETSLAAIAPSDLDLVDPLKHSQMSLEDLDEALPQLSLASVIRDLSHLKDGRYLVTVPSHKFIHALSQIIAVSRGETLQAFLVWKATQAYSDAIEDEIIDPWRAFRDRLTDNNPGINIDRERACIVSVNADFGWILSKFFVETQFSQAAKQVAEQIVDDTQSAMGQILDASTWMSSEDRLAAVLKLQNLRSGVGYPKKNPDILSSKDLTAYYGGVLVENNTYFENKVQSARARVVRAWSSLGKSPSELEWPITSTEVDATYDDTANKIFIPAAVIGLPLFYVADSPSYLAYASLGAVAGHEIVHGFDNVGSLYNESGSLGEWWSNHTRAMFDEKAECFEKQYSSYAVDGPQGSLSINGSLALRESIADNGGINAAYQAWINNESKNRSQRLPGLEAFDQKQLFWLAYGNLWCSKTTAASVKQQMRGSPYLPESIRIKGVTANSRNFREDFNCPKKEPVCELW